jgi:cytochrome P450
MRFARKDTVLPHGGGANGLSPMFVGKGSRVFYSIWAMHRLPEIWGDDAELFRPERWMDEKVPLRPGWGFLVSPPSPFFPAYLLQGEEAGEKKSTLTFPI